MKQKAFTLIELLVVVAIIGILAAVGVVAYNGYTGAAKVTTSKTNYKYILKHVTAEITKCNNGISNTFLTNDPIFSISCPIAHSNDLIAAMSTECNNTKGIYNNMKNVYKSSDRACRINTTLTKIIITTVVQRSVVNCPWMLITNHGSLPTNHLEAMTVLEPIMTMDL